MFSANTSPTHRGRPWTVWTRTRYYPREMSWWKSKYQWSMTWLRRPPRWYGKIWVQTWLSIVVFRILPLALCSKREPSPIWSVTVPTTRTEVVHRMEPPIWRTSARNWHTSVRASTPKISAKRLTNPKACHCLRWPRRRRANIFASSSIDARCCTTRPAHCSFMYPKSTIMWPSRILPGV